MDIYAKGQLSFLILNCLLERDFYGLDIISEISQRSNGRINLKKPSVYSNLTRMEKQGHVSSYMRSSDVGPNRRYYSITEKGRNTYQNLKEEFERNHFNVFRDFNEIDMVEEPVKTYGPKLPSIPIEEEEPEETGVMKQEDFFDFSSLDSDNDDDGKFLTETVPEEKQPEPVAIVTEEPQQVETPVVEESPVSEQSSEIRIEVNYPQMPQEPISMVQSTPVIEEKVEESAPIVEEPVKSDAVFLPKTDLNDPEYNKRIYDITKDFNKYRKRRSFAEDQMAMEVAENALSLQGSEVKKQQNLESFKSAILSNRGKFSDRLSEDEFNKTNHVVKVEEPVVVAKEEPIQDDGVFITHRVEEEHKSRKIEPPRLKIVAEHNPLPAPKRDTSIDPSHKEIISQLYSKSKGSDNEFADDTHALYDYDDLSDYYRSQRIAFKTYEHDRPVVKHNTNKINMFVSLFTFAVMCIISAVMFAVLYTKGLTNPNTSFLYIILPGIFLVDVFAKISSMRYTSWEPKPLMAQWKMWLLLLFSSGAIVGLNFIFGLQADNLIQYCATLFFPIAILIAMLPIRYYVKRFAYIKYWR